MDIDLQKLLKDMLFIIYGKVGRLRHRIARTVNLAPGHPEAGAFAYAGDAWILRKMSSFLYYIAFAQLTVHKACVTILGVYGTG